MAPQGPCGPAAKCSASPIYLTMPKGIFWLLRCIHLFSPPILPTDTSLPNIPLLQTFHYLTLNYFGHSTTYNILLQSCTELPKYELTGPLLNCHESLEREENSGEVVQQFIHQSSICRISFKDLLFATLKSKFWAIFNKIHSKWR